MDEKFTGYAIARDVLAAAGDKAGSARAAAEVERLRAKDATLTPSEQEITAQ